MHLIARESFHAHGRFLAAGTPVAVDDPVVAGREHLFASSEDPLLTPIAEQATAAPGEKRSTRRGGRKAAAAKKAGATKSADEAPTVEQPAAASEPAPEPTDGEQAPAPADVDPGAPAVDG